MLLYLHGGMPGHLPEQGIPYWFEDLFTVAWWEQRGSGISYSPDIPKDSLTVEQFVAGHPAGGRLPAPPLWSGPDLSDGPLGRDAVRNPGRRASGIAITNGTVRRAVYEERTGVVGAHYVSTPSLIALLGAYMWLIAGRWPIPTRRTALLIGSVWTMLTIGFEFGSGPLRGRGFLGQVAGAV